MVQMPNASNGEFSFYFFMLEPVGVGGSVVIFDTFTVPAEWNNTEMAELRDLKIKIEAFGVQAFNLDSCLAAMTEAFPSYFNFN